MSSEIGALGWFESVGLNVRITPERVVARCLINKRPPVSFQPSEPESVQRAMKAARSHSKIIYNRLCCNCSLPCTLRMLDDIVEAELLAKFGFSIF